MSEFLQALSVGVAQMIDWFTSPSASKPQCHIGVHCMNHGFPSLQDSLTAGLQRRMNGVYTEFMHIAQASGLTWEQAHLLYKQLLAEEVRETLIEEGIEIPFPVTS